jgi:hypothetical protein
VQGLCTGHHHRLGDPCKSGRTSQHSVTNSRCSTRICLAGRELTERRRLAAKDDKGVRF